MASTWTIVLVWVVSSLSAFAQSSLYPYTQQFDSSSALPAGWTASGFSVSGSSARSAPNCMSAAGNLTAKDLVSSAFDFRRHVPLALTYWERRSTTASAYRLEVLADFDTSSTLLASFNGTTSTTAYVQRIIPLGDQGFDLASSVRFRWRLRGDSTNGTGVIRIDDIVVAASSSVDLAVGRPNISPPLPGRRDTVVVRVQVQNAGREAVSQYSVSIHANNDRDQLFGTSPVSVQSGSRIEPGDSASFSVQLPPFAAGVHWIGARVSCVDDETSSNDTSSSSFMVSAAANDLVINEVMYAPVGDEPEWAELFNPGIDTIDIRSWTISDNSPTVRTRLSDQSLAVPPGLFVVVTSDPAFSVIHPDVSCPVIVAKFSSLSNSTPDAVVVRDAIGRTIDSMAYQPSLHSGDGRSLERIDAFVPAIDQRNWQVADSSRRSTPGRRNSTARLDHDLMMARIDMMPGTDPFAFRPLIACHVRNIGRRAVDHFRVTLSAMNTTQADTAWVLIDAMNVTQPVFQDDSAQVTFIPDSLGSGRTRFRAEVEYSADERTSNNVLEASFVRQFTIGRLIFNEIMYDPLAGSCEWVEVFNPSNAPLDMMGWSVSDAPTGSGSMNILPLAGTVPGNGFAVIAADSGILQKFPHLPLPPQIALTIANGSDGIGLNNDGDAVVLRDLSGTTIDSVRYAPQWHHPDVVDTKGRSLERINPGFPANDARNWSTSANTFGGTPGERNSVFAPAVRSSAAVSIAPNPFSPDGDGFEDVAVIRYALPFPTSIFNVKIFDIRGRLVRWLCNMELAGTEGTVVWDGTDDARERVHIGPYILLFQASASATEDPLVHKALIVVAKRL